MKIKNVIAITALSALVLSGCETKKVIEEEGGDFGEQSIEQLDSPYLEISEFFSEWELPEEGILPEDHEEYDLMVGGRVIYENGYIFDAETQDYIGRTYESNEESLEPTEGQATGFVKGLISEASGTLAHNSHLEKGSRDEYHIGFLLPSMESDFNQIVKYSKQEDLSKETKEILNSIKELRKDLENRVSDDDLKDLNIKYDKMADKIFQLDEAIKVNEE